MHTLNIKSYEAPLPAAEFKKKISLSSYFPAGTRYFYGYPAGEASGFLNLVPSSVEELVAARAFSCAGPLVSVVSFYSAASQRSISDELLEILSIYRPRERQITVLPAEIDTRLEGTVRNTAVKQALQQLMPAGSLVMAQPFTDESLVGLFQIPPSLTSWLNDKQNMSQYISPSRLPKRYASYDNGTALAKEQHSIVVPCVIKVASSSSGDGVFMCRSAAEVNDAAETLKNIHGAIIVEEYIETLNNYAIHFGVPHAADKPIDILGVNEQVTTPAGEFLGGLIHAEKPDKALQNAIDYLQKEVLPRVRDMGWYGIGGFDVLRKADNTLYFIDCNFRMTAMSAFHFLVDNESIKSPLLSFNGVFTGSQAELIALLAPLANKRSSRRCMKLVALSRLGDTWQLNGAILFEEEQQLRERIQTVLAAGVISKSLQQTLGPVTAELVR